MSRRRPKPLASVIDFAAAVKRREESQGMVEREVAVSYLPFSFDEPVDVRGGRVEVVIDRYEGVGLSMEPEDALTLAKALRAAARSAKRKGAG